MKKNIILIVSIMLLVFMVSCQQQEDIDTASSSLISESQAFTAVNVEEYASQGVMYPLEVKLGDSADTVKTHYKSESDEALSEAGHDHDDITLTITESDDYTEMNAVNEIYYYRSGTDKKISAIVSYSNPYDFPLYVATEQDVKSALGEPERSGNAEAGDIFFMFGTSAESYRVMVYTYNSNRVTFIFYENTMMAATLINPAIWDKAE